MVNGPEGPLLDKLDADGWDRIDQRACEQRVRQSRGRIFTAAQEHSNPNRPWGLLEPCAVTSRSHGSEGGGAQQCVPPTRRGRPLTALSWKSLSRPARVGAR